ncbi:phosphotransferase [Nodularia sp. UHCC 0506]|uniref:phosphotransferase n=1 Tax=Nodularia sp. UHCC 0506 TaxID=3110243 RepID=UPI002B2175C4|nr:phosphotransferase [Nodularia sp. UHCC 0506]MEA5516752.1 phosphotransferase [Nodularia sp. UHCC 0506]
MTLLLSFQNVGDYLLEQGLCSQSDKDNLEIKPVTAKNFNLLVTFPDGHKLLVKQERHDQEGKAAGEFMGEVRVQNFLEQFPQLNDLRCFLPSLLHFDPQHSIIIFSYLDQYRDLADYHTKENTFPEAIATTIGNILATTHRTTFNSQEYQDFFCHTTQPELSNLVPHFISGLERISPEIFGLIPADGLKFFALYQRYESLGQALAELGNAFTPSCLTHNDLKLNNILLHTDWQNSPESVRLIDWERSAWGDPAYDLGMLIASYLQIWLSSLVISPGISGDESFNLNESLRLATTPLDAIQPTIAALSLAYLEKFPEIIQYRPNFWRRVVQFAGLALIQQIQAMIQYQKTFNNTGIAFLQVAKSLLCRPEQSMPTVFGTASFRLNEFNFAA